MAAPPATLRLGVDLGGSKIEIVALDSGGAELLRRRTPTPGGDYAAIVEAVAALVLDAEAELGAVATVGIGTPGSVSPATGLLRNSNTTVLNGRALQADLERRLGRALRLANDANCFAVSEASDGAGAGAGVVFGVILGTGVGGGILVDGRLLSGANAVAGEWGHNPLPWPREEELPGEACYCGQHGCIETWLSGPALARGYARLGGEAPGAAAIAARAESGADARAETVLRGYEERLARALAQVINLLDPDVIVLGGGLSGIARLYRTVPALWARHVFSDRVATRLLPPRHGDASGVRGAARLWQAEPD